MTTQTYPTATWSYTLTTVAILAAVAIAAVLVWFYA